MKHPRSEGGGGLEEGCCDKQVRSSNFFAPNLFMEIGFD